MALRQSGLKCRRFFYICCMTIQELEDFFAAHEVPPNTMLNKAATIIDPKKFLEVNLNVIKAWKGDLNKCPSYWHLCELANVIDLAKRQ